MSVINNSVTNSSDYKDGNSWLMLGDCLERMKEIPDGSVDAVICDPVAQAWYNQHTIMRLG